MPSTRGGLIVVALVASLIATSTSGRPPRPGTDDNGLTETESATLWAADNDSRYITNAEYRAAYGENRTAIQQLANGTDIPFTRPPATAATWTRNDHADFPNGTAATSRYPRHANLTNGTYIRAAHTTIFAVTPATTAHQAPTTTRTYVAPSGTLRGVVDYRVRGAGLPPGNRSVDIRVRAHEISEIRLYVDGERVATTDGSHHPALAYALDGGPATLRLEADIRATVAVSHPGNRTSNRTHNRTPNRTHNRTHDRTANRTARNDTTDQATPGGQGTQVVTETITVADTVSVTGYDLRATVRYATYPNGDTGVAVYKNRPWQGLVLTANGTHRVRGIWRFYTARDPRWDTLQTATRNGTETVRSPALPVSVHAYPSRLGPRVEPILDGPHLLEVWGTQRGSPAPTIPEPVNVEVVTAPYETSFGLAVRAPTVDRDALVARGIVRGVNATLVEPAGGSRRQIRASNLTLTLLAQTERGARFRVRLTDARTGEPITLVGQGPRYDPIIPDSRDGYITVAGRRVETNASGLATVEVTTPGYYTAQYHPGSWLEHDPAYTAATATARWHPLATLAGWLALISNLLVWLLPVAAAIYAGRHLGRLFRTPPYQP